jgi:hypothetical protein
MLSLWRSVSNVEHPRNIEHIKSIIAQYYQAMTKQLRGVRPTSCSTPVILCRNLQQKIDLGPRRCRTRAAGTSRRHCECGG